MKKILFVFTIFMMVGCAKPKEEPQSWLISAPASTEFTTINKGGVSVIPNGRFLTPLGKTIETAPHPYGLTLSNNGKIAVTANSGTAPLSITIIRGLDQESPSIQQVPEGPQTDRGILASVYMGLAISPDDSLVYVAGGQANGIYSFDLATGKKLDFIDCRKPASKNAHGYIGDLILNGSGNFLYAVDQVNFEVLKINAQNGTVEKRIKVGRYPFGLTLSPDQSTLFVANVGMYEYSVLDSFDPQRPVETAADFPPFAYLSKESIEGINTDSLKAAGLGDPNVPESFSVWAVDLQQDSVIAKVKTGFLVGEVLDDIPAVGGSSPNSLVATDTYVFVSNGNNDCISVIDLKNYQVIKNIFLQPDPRLGNLRGIIPFGVALSPDQKRLFVAESGLNAVGIIDTKSLEVLGHIPVGWFPGKLQVSPDGKTLVVANAKGYGSGPNGGPEFDPEPVGHYIGNLMKGTVSIIEIPADNQLDSLSKIVMNNNFRFYSPPQVESQNPIPSFPGASQSPIRHIVFISKENRTYDEVFGQVEAGNGIPAMARYGRGASFTNRAGTDSVMNATIMPNHLAMAEEFAISDNFYVDADVSADGHRWLVCTYPNEWVEVNTAASYGGNRSQQRGSDAPGNLAIESASGAIYPEDYNEAGSMWEHLERNQVDFYNFGFGVMFEPHFTTPEFKYTGYKHVINYPVPAPIFEKTSRSFPTYNMAIPDQFRVDRFIDEFTSKWLDGDQKMPPVITVIIPNDHGANDRPEAGYPYRESYMADNDLAVGRIVEFLSHTPYWKEMAIFITEDDAQDGRDHIDAHRSLLMVASPFVKRGYVGHHHYSFGSIFKTFWHILGIPYLNQYDAGANDLSDLFTEDPDLTPYQAKPVDARVFDPQKALDPFDEEFDWKAMEEGPDLDDPQEMMQE